MHRTRNRQATYAMFVLAAIAICALVVFLTLPLPVQWLRECPVGRVPVFYVARGTVECQLLDDENLAL